MKNAIITCSDEKYGDFLINHWMKSLKETNDLKKIDVIIIDYGLSKSQLDALKKQKAIVYTCVRDGFPNSIKFRDMNNILSNRKYDQVITCDGGDIIFQNDISELFKKDKSKFRAVCETVSAPFDKLYMAGFEKNVKKEIKRVLNRKKLINAGMIAAPYELFRKMCKECDELIKERTFGPDSVAINYILYREGFKEMDITYNFVITTAHRPFYIKKGVFYLNNGERISIVHNAGGRDFFRPVNNFGYGRQYNKIKGTFLPIKSLIKVTHSFAQKLR